MLAVLVLLCKLTLLEWLAVLVLGAPPLLLWASDWPHWQFDGDAAVPPGFPASLLPKLMRGNALATYDRLRAGEGSP